VQKLTLHRLICHPLSGLPLFDWCPAPVSYVAPVAVRKLAQHYGVTIPRAIVVALLNTVKPTGGVQ
jgi:hypothetical protein